MSIKPGDMVVVVKPTHCCGDGRALGMIFTVAEIHESATVCCPKCGHFERGIEVASYSELPGTASRLSRLKKLDAPLLSDDVETSDEVTA